jgi:hypothetical protein
MGWSDEVFNNDAFGVDDFASVFKGSEILGTIKDSLRWLGNG